MASDAHPYGIGSNVWPGLAKLLEEMGELGQVLGKVMACDGPDAVYWDGTSLRPQLLEEMGDVQAALLFFLEHNDLSRTDLHLRANMKLDKFRHWHEVTRLHSK